MSNEAIINELAGIKASAELLAHRSAKLIKMMDEKPVTNKAGFNKKIATVLANREKRYQKK